MEVKTQDISIKLIEANKGQIEGLPKNPRLIKDHKFEKLVKSIEENPEMLNMRWLWNNPQSGQSPYKLFEGALVPQGKDTNGNLIYKYNGAKF